MRSSALTAAAVAVLGCTVSACGGDHTQPHRTGTAPSRLAIPSGPSIDVLSLSGLGVFEGRCPRGARSWRLRFVNVDAATDTVSYRVGTGGRRTVNVDPGGSITFRLVQNTTRTHEPADRFVPPLGQGRGRTAATSVPSTAPLQVTIYQGTEPQTLRADIRLALGTIGGESGRCVLVGSTLNAYTYPH